MTFLQIVNKILLKLREDQVSDVNRAASVSAGPYSELIGQFVNDIKQEVEEATQWTYLTDSVITTLDTVAEPDDIYALGKLTTEDQLYVDPDTGQTLVFDDTNKQRLWPIPISTLRLYQNVDSIPTAQGPMYYNISGLKNGYPKLTVWPYLSSNVDIKMEVVSPQDPLEADTDVLVVPWMPVYLGAYSKALFERGENQGDEYQTALNEYKTSLTNAVTDDLIRQSVKLHLHPE